MYYNVIALVPQATGSEDAAIKVNEIMKTYDMTNTSPHWFDLGKDQIVSRAKFIESDRKNGNDRYENLTEDQMDMVRYVIANPMDDMEVTKEVLELDYGVGQVRISGTVLQVQEDTNLHGTVDSWVVGGDAGGIMVAKPEMDYWRSYLSKGDKYEHAADIVRASDIDMVRTFNMYESSEKMKPLAFVTKDEWRRESYVSDKNWIPNPETAWEDFKHVVTKVASPDTWLVSLYVHA